MKYQTSEQGDAIVVVFSGDIDLEFSADVREVLLDGVARARRVLVDMSGVSLIDSSGVASLLEGFQSARKKGKDFVLVAAAEPVMRVLKLARLDTVFDTAESVAAAMGDAG